MGVPRLLPQLRSISRPKHLSEYSGSICGVDGHVWLHRSVYTDAENLAAGFDVSSHIKYFLKRAERLTAVGVRPIFVFDGADLPGKSRIQANRSSNRAMSMGRAIALRDTGYSMKSYTEFAKATDLRFYLVRDIVQGLNLLGIQAVVAPYEADAQLALMARLGLIDFVISEDSDLLVYGCPRVLFKWDPVSLFGVEVHGRLSDASPFHGLNSDEAITACVLAGSDYGAGIAGVGIIRATKIMRDISSAGISPTLHNIVDFLMKTKNVSVPMQEDVVERLRISRAVFRHQTVFTPANGGGLIPLNPYTEIDVCNYAEYLGAIYQTEKAWEVYRGRAHPVSHSLYTGTDSGCPQHVSIDCTSINS